MPKHDNFLADTVRPRPQHISYFDGLRFGFGFFVSGLVVALVLSGLSWGIIALLHVH